ncbi:MAG: hypothetical protein JRJ03_01260 [Deltaproteobacteria bacterium]|nr:hypothetical protein [Deltaproteobacteria bacterium]
MGACLEYREYLYLDVIGELAPEARGAWEAHLSSCGSCRHEREKMARLLDTLGRDARPPSLSRFEVNVLRQKVSARIGANQKAHWLPVALFGRLKLVVPLAGAACLFVLSLFGFWSWWPGESNRVPSGNVARLEHGELGGSEKEIIENMDLLEHMDTIRVLVKVVDNKEVI